MLLRLVSALLLLFLLFNLPFPDIKEHKKQIYLYHNREAEEFLSIHKSLKKNVHLVDDFKNRPLVLITTSLDNYNIKNFDLVYIKGKKKEDLYASVYRIPTRARIKDTVYFNSDYKVMDENGRVLKKLPVLKKHNFAYVRINNRRYRIDIRGVQEHAYVIDTIKEVASYHGALRRYFEGLPFVNYVEIMPKGDRFINYFRDSVRYGSVNFEPVLLVIGKDIKIEEKTDYSNPEGFYLAFKDTVVPVGIKNTAVVKKKNIYPVAFIIGKEKIPFAYVYQGVAYFSTPEIDVLYRSYPALFNSIMDSLLRLITTPLVYPFPVKQFVKEGEPLKIMVVCIPFCKDCRIIHGQRKEICLKDTVFLSSYTFVPSLDDTLVIVKAGNTGDTVFFHVIKRDKKITFDENKFVNYIYANTYSLRFGWFSKARDSMLFYIVLLFSLFITWFYEKKRSG